ncbi:short subunit dehydrogenase [Bacillus sp. VMFN-A1]|nr:short subunit dehydrogenase [Bacillus sp. VMFN-A1]
MRMNKKGLQLEILHLDVTDEESVREAARNVGESLDVIINNAAILNGRGTSIEDLDIEAIKLAFDVNTLGPARVIKHFLPLLKKGENQSIINISSEGGSLTNAYSGDYPYGLSKAALNMLSEKLHVALKRRHSSPFRPSRVGKDGYGRNDSPDTSKRNRRRYL